MKLQRNEKTGQYFINLPKALIEAKKWDKGQAFKITFNEKGNMVLEEVK